MTTHPDDTPDSTPEPATTATGAEMQCTHGRAAPVPEMQEPLPATAEASRKVPRGLTARIGTWPLQEAIWLRSLTLATYLGGMVGRGVAQGAQGAAQIEGDVRTTGDVVAGGISLQGHTHGGVQRGGDSTGAPQ